MQGRTNAEQVVQHGIEVSRVPVHNRAGGRTRKLLVGQYYLEHDVARSKVLELLRVIERLPARIWKGSLVPTKPLLNIGDRDHHRDDPCLVRMAGHCPSCPVHAAKCPRRSPAPTTQNRTVTPSSISTCCSVSPLIATVQPPEQNRLPELRTSVQ